MFIAPSIRPSKVNPIHRAQGVTLIELVVAMSIAGILMGAIMGAWSWITGHSSDSIILRQELSVGQSLMREIELQPLPSDPNTSTGQSGRAAFTSILSYNGFTMTGISDIEGNAIAGLQNYSASVTVTAQGIASLPASSGYWITVNVVGPDNSKMQFAEWRSTYE